MPSVDRGISNNKNQFIKIKTFRFLKKKKSNFLYPLLSSHIANIYTYKYLYVSEELYYKNIRGENITKKGVKKYLRNP